MNYYSEFYHNAAEWLRELINQGLIPPGDVDERSIEDVAAADLLGYTQCHFFAGIGGWSLALRLAGWPDDRPVWTGSCPCQCFSTAGKQRGFADERDLWPVFADLIRQCRPEFVFGEQVENAIRHGWLDRVYADMEREGYAVGAHVLGAHSVGAPHRRYRLYWGAASVAYCANDGRNERMQGAEGSVGQGECRGLRESAGKSDDGGMAENSDGGGCGGWNDGNQTGRGREVQVDGLGDRGGVDDTEGIGRGIRNAENIGKADGEVNAFANASCGGCGVAYVQGNGRFERRAEPDGRGASAGCGDIGIPDPSGERCGEAGGGVGRCAERTAGDHTGLRLADNNGERQQERCISISMAPDEQRESEAIGAELRSLSGLPPWSNSRFIYCRDGKVRRIPAESLLFRVADGISGGVDGGGFAGISEDGGFPLTTQKEGRAMLLKGYGNAIVPQVAAQFIGAFMEA